MIRWRPSVQKIRRFLFTRIVTSISKFTGVRLFKLKSFVTFVRWWSVVVFFFEVMAVSALFLCIFRSVFFYWLSMRTTKYLHEKMLRNVMNTKTRFFDLNPIGRIMNRFSKDVGNLDDVLPVTLFEFCHVILTLPDWV